MTKQLKNPTRKYDAGVTMSGPLNIQCEQLLKQWLLEPFQVHIYGEEMETKTNIDKIYSQRILEELINYSREGNFDHVSSLKLLVLWLSQENEEPIQAHSYETDYMRPLNKFLHSRVHALKKTSEWYAY